jgi:hypothetical protein
MEQTETIQQAVDRINKAIIFNSIAIALMEVAVVLILFIK